MQRRAKTPDRGAAEALCSGAAPDGHGDLATLLGRVREEFGGPPTPEVSDRHLAAMRAAARHADDDPAALVAARGTSRPRRLVWARRPLVAVAMTGVVLAGGVAAAATGRLPEPVQSTAANALEALGVDMPPVQPDADPAAEAAASQGAFDATCAQVAAEVRDRIAGGLATLAGLRPDLDGLLAALRGDLSGTIGRGLCDVRWAAAVAHGCPPSADATTITPNPPAVVASLPAPLQQLLATPCTVDWAALDWTAVFAALAPDAVVRSACTWNAATTATTDQARARRQRVEALCANGLDAGRWQAPAPMGSSGSVRDAQPPAPPTQPDGTAADRGSPAATPTSAPRHDRSGTGDGGGAESWDSWDGWGGGGSSSPPTDDSGGPSEGEWWNGDGSSSRSAEGWSVHR